MGALKSSNLEPLLDKVKEQEKKYEWLQAAEYYKKASGLAVEENDFLKAAEFQERTGFCFYRAAHQAETNREFQKLLKQAIQSYEKESEILEKTKAENKPVRITHAHALVAYTKSRLETSFSKKRELINKWWRLEKQVLKAAETSGDAHSVGRTCSNLIEWSIYGRFFLAKNSSEREKIFQEAIYLGEKAIRTLSKLDDEYELARAYCFASWYYGMSQMVFDDEDRLLQFAQKCQSYANKALELSQKIGDAWLIGRSHHSALNAPQNLTANPVSAIEYSEKMLKLGNIAKDNYVIGFGKSFKNWANLSIASNQLEDPDKQREEYEKSIEVARGATHNFQIINHPVGFAVSYSIHCRALLQLASIETDQKTKQDIIEMAHKVMQDGMKRLQGWEWFANLVYGNLSWNLALLSETKKDLVEKRDLLQKALFYQEKALAYSKEIRSFSPYHRIYSEYALLQFGLANLEKNKVEKIRLLTKAVVSIEKAIELAEKSKKLLQSAWASGAFFGNYYYRLGIFLHQIYDMTKERTKLTKAIEAFKQASFYYTKAELPTNVAESNWHTAQLYGEIGETQGASENYELAAESYDLASKKIPSLKQFYENYSSYMRAWSQIEQAKYSHSIEEYEEARQHYEKAAKLHELTEKWSYLASNYLAWASMEEAEGLSRGENTQQAELAFQKALEHFTIAEKSIEKKLEITSADEKEMAQKLLRASDLRRRYCQARILLEKAKLLDREGKNLQSAKKYVKAAQNISAIIEKIDNEAERKELELLTILCQAWEKMALAEEATSSESYLEAAALFEKAKDRCFTKRASLWTLGNSNFCKGLSAGIRYQGNMDLKENASAKRYLKNAASSYLQAGFRNASEYAKATQRLFDAYAFMNQAESEIDPEKKAKQYQMAENLLQIAAGSFMKAKQPEKTAQVQQILKTVREEKALAVSLTQVMQAPTVTSSTFSFTAPTPTNEASVGLESFEHANVQANLVAATREVRVGESFCLSIEFINAGKGPALLTRVEHFVPPDFLVVKKPEIYRLEDECLNMKGKQLAPLKLVEAKLVLQPSKKGVYQLKPKVNYLTEQGQSRFLELKSLEIHVEEVVLSDRVATGTKELDSLLLGGIPKEYAVALTGPPSDEREKIIKNFLKAGTKKQQITFYVTSEAVNLENLLEQPNFYLFLCNPKPKIKVPDLSNVHKLRSKTDLTNLSIALSKACRNLEQNLRNPKRFCVEIVSDVLITYEAEATRRWISELITNMGSKGFTLLAVMDPDMHPTDQAKAVLNLFDGEISLYQTEDPLECKKSIRVKKLRNQDYIKNPICLTN
ncbi:MAG: ATPase domain-containing protein [Candidatus Bathyarchaeota archaeon]